MKYWTDDNMIAALDNIVERHRRKYKFDVALWYWHRECMSIQKERNRKPRVLVSLDDKCSCIFIEGNEIEFDDCGAHNLALDVLEDELKLTNPKAAFYEIDWIRRKITRKTNEYVNRVWVEGGLLG